MIKLFTATWCTPCTLMKSNLTAEDLEGVELIDIDEHPEIVKKFSVGSVPTLIKFDTEGLEIDRQLGVMSRNNFLAFKNV